MIVLAYGVPGAGKSTLLHDLVKAQSPVQRFFVNAHSPEWDAPSPHWRGRAPQNLRVVQGSEELDALVEELQKADDALPEEHHGVTPGVFVVHNVESGEVVSAAVRLGWSTYVDDEIDLIARRKGWEESPLRQLVHQGRHLENDAGEFTECHLMGACRRPQNLHTDLTDLADEAYLFRLQGGNTRKRLELDSMIEGDEEWERVKALPNFSFKHVVPGTPGSWMGIFPLGEKRGEKKPRARKPQQA